VKVALLWLSTSRRWQKIYRINDWNEDEKVFLKKTQFAMLK